MANAQHLIEGENVCACCGTLISGDHDAPLTSRCICGDCSAKMKEEINGLSTDQIHPDRASRERKLPECLQETAAEDLENMPGVDVDWDMFSEDIRQATENHRYYHRMAKLAIDKINAIKREFGDKISSIYVTPAPYWINIQVFFDEEMSNQEDYAIDLLDIFGGSIIDYDA